MCYPGLNAQNEEETLQEGEARYRVEEDDGVVCILTDVKIDLVLPELLLQTTLEVVEVVREDDSCEEIRHGEGHEADDYHRGAEDGDQAGGQEDCLLALHDSLG